MRISEALKEVKDLEVHFGPATLKLTYRPPSWTPRELDALKADKDIRRVVDQIRKLVIQWDLTDEYDRLVPLALPVAPAPTVIVSEGGQDLEQEPAEAPIDPLMDVPLSIYMKIITAINEDGRPDPQA
jgi:hypothetical protein